MRKQSLHKKEKIVQLLQDGQFYYKRGLKAYHQTDVNRACKLLERAAALEPRNTDILVQLALIYAELGQFQQSNEVLTEVINSIDKDLMECYHFMANNYAHLGLFREAYKMAIVYLKKAPDGEFFEDNEDLLDLLAIEGVFEEDELNDSDELIMKQDMAKTLLEDGMLDEAVILLKEITEEYPEFWSAYNNLSLAYFYLGELELAKKYLLLVLEKNPGNLHALCNLLVFYYYERQDDQVEELVQKLAVIYPIMTEHQYKLGATFALVGRYQEAYRWLKSLYRKGFEVDDTFYYWLSYSAYYTGRENFAKSVWEKVLEMNPEKSGSEPWTSENDSATEEKLEDRLFAIFLDSVKKKRLTVQQETKRFLTDFEKDFFHFAQLKKEMNETDAGFMYKAAEKIYAQETAEEEGIRFLFQIIVKAQKEGLSLANYHGWAAAIHYFWLKSNNVDITKKAVAEQFDIATSTLTKYEKMVVNLKSSI